ncbi:MAG TPA: TorF family putative porin [Hyphomicrobiaceae bacterium]|jgi:uncharacterized protein (TIGR02001 family)
MNGAIARSTILGAAALLLAGPALADGMPGKVKAGTSDLVVDGRACALSANLGYATEYVYRGFSYSAEDGAVQGGFDATCGRFYAGVWASSINFGGGASSEFDISAGFKHITTPIAWDVGLVYHAYPNAREDFFEGRNPDYAEIKVGASGEVWRGGTMGATVFYSPDYQFNTGSTWTVEGTFSQTLPKFGIFSPTFSALIGYQTNQASGDDGFIYSRVFGNGFNADHYTYWNAGVTLAFLEKWSLDLRYWDSDHPGPGGGVVVTEDNDFCRGAFFQCDSRFVATLKYSF